MVQGDTMNNQIDVETLLKHYSEGRISKQEFLHLHSLITQQQYQQQQYQQQQYEQQQYEQQNVQQQNYHQQEYQQQRYQQQQYLQELDAAQEALQYFPMTIVPPEPDVRSGGMVHFVKTYLKSIVAFTGSLSIVSTLALNYYHHFIPNSAGREHETAQKYYSVNDFDKQNKQSKKDIFTLAESLMNNPIWDARAINRFTTQWVALSDTRKDLARKDQWYSGFIDAMKKQVKFELARRNGIDKSSETENRQRALMHLAVTLNIISLQKPPNNLAELDSALSSLPAVPANVTAKSSTQPSAQSEDMEGSSFESDNAGSELQEAEFAAMSEKDKIISQKVTAILQDLDDVDIKSVDIVNVMDQYVDAYRKGNRQKIVSLFADDKALRRPLTLSAIQSQYNNLFKSTEERRVEFTRLMWERHDAEAMGKGEFHTTFRVMPGGQLKTVNTKIMLAMRKIDNVTRITDFELMDNGLFSLSAAGAQKKTVEMTGINGANQSGMAQQAPPTRAELQDLVSRYMDNYRSGNIDRLMKLFASSNWTTAPEGLTELRRDYRDLFRSTSNRQVRISNIDWSFKGNKAMGTGDLVVDMRSRETRKSIRKKGKVRIVVIKTEKPLISHLFQIMD